MKKRSTNEFIALCNKVHNGKYTYNKTIYTNKRSKVIITCPIHGDFSQIAHSHLNGRGCPLCGKNSSAKNRTTTTAQFCQKASEIHENKYDYTKVDYIDAHTKVCIICPEHGEFWQKPSHHLCGHGCKKCSISKRSKGRTLTTEQFKQKAEKVHNGKYNYTNLIYFNSSSKVCIICPKHGEFWQLPHDHIDGHGCPKCANSISNAENEIIKMLSPCTPIQRYRKVLSKKEIDIYIPSLKLGIEYNGLRWHSENFGKDKYYHINKLNDCNKQGINLIQIFEDEWINHREICESKLKHICGMETNKSKIFARKCYIKEIGNIEAKYFMERNHIQGYASSTVYLGAFYGNQLIGVMTFKREKEGYWDLNRFATDINYNCIGIGGKLFKYFIKNYQFVEIKSFADRRWTASSIDNLYTKLGFKVDKFTNPDYHYIKENIYKRFHKFGFRKQILSRRYGFPMTMTELEMAKELGYDRIWDCGLIKYVYKNEASA